jgi:NADH:ubiquinone reductase (H+-translocating)
LQLEWLTFVVVGAGPTGVELAGAFAEIARCVLTREFRRINTARAKIILVEAGSRILAGMSPYASAQARRQLERLGVEILTSMPVGSIDASGLTCGNKRIAARTIVWAAGVAASPLGRALGVAVDRAGRIPVTPELALPGHQEVFIVGDLAAASTDGKPVPGLAADAKQEGKHAAHNVLRAISGKPPKAFRYTDLGTLATVGRGAAVGDFHRFRLAGLSAWLLWLLVHIFYLVGFRSRILVIAQLWSTRIGCRSIARQQQTFRFFLALLTLHQCWFGSRESLHGTRPCRCFNHRKLRHGPRRHGLPAADLPLSLRQPEKF